jgi:serine/threonine protein kinase
MKDTFLNINQKLVLPDLSDKLGLKSPDFVVQNIFQGGMGTCAKIQSADNQFFALKIIHTSLLENELALQRYIDEMKTWLTLSACNGVVEAFCLTTVNQVPCIAAQWMDRGNLRPYISQINSELFYRNIDRIASTLEWAFTNYSIIHRDLKPENILLDRTGNAFIADWGLSRPISKQSAETNFENALNKLSNRLDITEAGSFLGTIVYSSPEQILGMKSIDHRSDIYSLGCIMYEWETGRPPFFANTPHEIALQHLRNKPQKIGGVFKTTNFKVAKIIEKCLEKNPEKRFQSYSELLKAFNNIATKNINHKRFVVAERYKVPLIGEDEFKEKLKGEKLKAIYTKEGEYAIIEESEVDPYLKEGESLIALGEYEKARDIFEGFYVHDFFRKIPDSFFVQYVCVNFALALRYTGEIEKGILVLRTLDEAM